MSAFIERNWVAFALLSIAIPMALLATFRLIGVLHEPPEPKTITVEAVGWNMSRPEDICNILEWVNNSYFTDEVSVVLNVSVLFYHEDSTIIHPYALPIWDALELMATATASVNNGFIQSVAINLSRTDSNASIYVWEQPFRFKLQNLTIEEVKTDYFSTEAYVNAPCLNQSKQGLLGIAARWLFFDENNRDHWITVTLEVVYFNGTEYERVIVPIKLGVLIS